MTAREIKIAKLILTVLHNLDGGQAHPIMIHGEIGGMSVCNVDEFDEVIAELNRSKFIIGVTTQFKGTLWSISDLGESARRKM